MATSFEALSGTMNDDRQVWRPVAWKRVPDNPSNCSKRYSQQTDRSFDPHKSQGSSLLSA